MKKNGFTQIELIIVIVLVMIVIAVDIAIILYLNQKSRDVAVLSDIKQIQSGLDVYLVGNTHYPVASDAVNLNDLYAGTEKLCTSGFQKAGENCSFNILNPVPNSDRQSEDFYIYQSADGSDYKLEFTLKTNFKAQNLSKGKNCATSTQILSQPCF